MAGNEALGKAKDAKLDEFYTQLSDIEKELRHYRKHFKGKTVLCNCDDPFESKFFEYFVKNFNRLELKKLIATCFAGSLVMGKQLSLFDVVPDAAPGTPYKAVVTSVYDATGDGYIDMFDVKKLFITGENELTELAGDGDFRSEECLALLDEADIVVTNPPFSLFREYIASLVARDKKFIIIGNINAIKYKEVFPLLKDDKIWMGATYFNGGAAYFMASPELYDPEKMSNPKNAFMKDGIFYWRVNGVRWYTNLDIRKRHEELVLIKRYDPELYPKYANYDAIEVAKVTDIPCDYAGYMGVPISFMDKYNPEQFEIIGCMNIPDTLPGMGPIGIDWVERYRSQGGTGHVSANMMSLVFYTKDGTAKRSFDRIIIRNRHPEQPKER